jgi:hypothetical protein
LLGQPAGKCPLTFCATDKRSMGVEPAASIHEKPLLFQFPFVFFVLILIQRNLCVGFATAPVSQQTVKDGL